MLSEFHSYDAIKEELKKKEVHYYMIRNGEKLVGYAGMRLEEPVLFLSKLYILSSERGKGAGKISIGFILQVAKYNNISLIFLTVINWVAI